SKRDWSQTCALPILQLGRSRLEFLRAEDGDVLAEHLADLCEGIAAGDLLRGDGAQRAVLLVDHHDDAVGPLGQQIRGLTEGPGEIGRASCRGRTESR